MFRMPTKSGNVRGNVNNMTGRRVLKRCSLNFYCHLKVDAFSSAEVTSIQDY